MGPCVDPVQASPKGSTCESAAELETTVRMDGGQAVLAVFGEVDAATADRFRAALVEAQDAAGWWSIWPG
jgi:hypothetical protein